MITKISRMDKLPGGGGGVGVVLSYVTYIGRVPPPWVAFLPHFWSENMYTLCPFWSGIGYGF